MSLELPRPATTSLVPSAEQAITIGSHDAVFMFVTHVTPEFFEIPNSPAPTAAMVVPSAEQARQLHPPKGAPVCVQVTPESTDRYMAASKPGSFNPRKHPNQLRPVRGGNDRTKLSRWHGIRREGRSGVR